MLAAIELLTGAFGLYSLQILSTSAVLSSARRCR